MAETYPDQPYPYLIFYEVRGEEVVIHAIRHAARNPSRCRGSLNARLTVAGIILGSREQDVDVKVDVIPRGEVVGA